MVSPASIRPSPSVSVGVPACLSSSSASTFDIAVEVLETGETTPAPPGSLAVAVALLSTRPASTSAWVIR